MATLTVTITETLPDYNGVDNDLTLTNELTVSGVDDVYHRIITCPANSETRLVDFHSSEPTRLLVLVTFKMLNT